MSVDHEVPTRKGGADGRLRPRLPGSLPVDEATDVLVAPSASPVRTSIRQRRVARPTTLVRAKSPATETIIGVSTLRALPRPVRPPASVRVVPSRPVRLLPAAVPLPRLGGVPSRLGLRGTAVHPVQAFELPATGSPAA